MYKGFDLAEYPNFVDAIILFNGKPLYQNIFYAETYEQSIAVVQYVPSYTEGSYTTNIVFTQDSVSTTYDDV